MNVRSLMNQDAASARRVKNACGLNGLKVLLQCVVQGSTFVVVRDMRTSSR